MMSGIERPGGRRRLGQRHLGDGIAVVVGGADGAKRLAVGLDRVVGAPEGVAGIFVERGDRT